MQQKETMSNQTILILDNERPIQWALKTLLESGGYSVTVADTTEQAVSHFSKNVVAGLITEYRIDQTSTVGAIRDLKSRFPEVYVMMLTEDELKGGKYEEIINAGVDDYFRKPFPAEKILLHLRKGLKQREILLQKKRMEQKLDRIKRKRSFPFVGFIREGRMTREKSF